MTETALWLVLAVAFALLLGAAWFGALRRTPVPFHGAACSFGMVVARVPAGGCL